MDPNLGVTNFLLKNDDEGNLDITTLSLNDSNEAEKRLLTTLLNYYKHLKCLVCNSFSLF